MSTTLQAYLTDHLAGSAAALELFERLFKESPPLDARLRPVYEDIKVDREILVDLMKRLDVQPGVIKQTAGWLGERLLALKHIVEGAADDGFVLMSLELLSIGILGKFKLWTALSEARDEGLPLEGVDFGRLQDRALAQHALVEEERLSAVRIALAPASQPRAT